MNNNYNNNNISSSNSSSSSSNNNNNFSIKPQSSRLNNTEQQLGVAAAIEKGQAVQEEEDYAMEDIETDTERMQADLYDDNDDDDDDDDDGLDEEGTSLFADDEQHEQDEDDDDDEEPEQLPDPKSLISVDEKQQQQEEEEDMGYDEDDERLALERPRTTRPRADEEHFVNEEGSGAGAGAGYKSRFKPNNSFRLSQLENIRKKLLTESQQEELAAVAAGAVAVPSTAIDLRESSGHFANDDEDGEDNDDGVDDEYSDNADSGVGFFNSQRSKSASNSNSNHYFRKNSNDAIKIISTPLGKVGIVYQQTPTDGELDQQQLQQQQKQLQEQAKQKPATQFTDFDALSPDPESSHRFPSPHPKITPVLTPDGKVALLYRGDSESSKYEPIRNLTHKFSSSNSNSKSPEQSKPANEDTSDDSSDDSVYTDSEDESAGDKPAPAAGAVVTPKPLQPEILEPPEHAPSGGSFIIRPTSDSLLPMINRPLSEVLGIKKNQFQETRVRDPTLGGTEATPRSLISQQPEQKPSSTLHFLTKVNLAEYPTTTKQQQQHQLQLQLPTGRDFDFSRDNTMLDERSRVREMEQQREREREHNEATSKGSGSAGTEAHTIANEQLLSKTEVINLAIIPQFDEDMERLQRLHENSGIGSRQRHHRTRHRHKQTDEELSGIHCVMQVMMGIAAISTVFGMLGTFFKQRILDQLRTMHW